MRRGGGEGTAGRGRKAKRLRCWGAWNRFLRRHPTAAAQPPCSLDGILGALPVETPARSKARHYIAAILRRLLMKFRSSGPSAWALVIILSLAVFAAPLLAQSGVARLQGRVTDPTGAMIPGPTISFKNTIRLPLPPHGLTLHPL